MVRIRPALPLAAGATVALVLLFAGLAHGQDAPVAGDGPFDLTLFHTNDIHGAFAAEPASWRPDSAAVGGFVALGRHLAAERRTAAAATVLVDAGDFMSGNPVTALRQDGIAGAAMAELMNLTGYDVSVAGNHEFDRGRDNLVKLAGILAFPLLAADLAGSGLTPGPVTLTRDGLDIGVVGISCSELRNLVPPERLGDLTQLDQVPAVRVMLADLVPRTDLQVLISHDGIEGDRELARQLAGSGLDVIVGGHSHTRLEKPEVVDGIIIVQAGSNLKNLGRLDLAVEGGRVTEYRGRLVELTVSGGEEGGTAAVAAAVARWQAEVVAVYGERIGEIGAALHRSSTGESELGDWLCDAIRRRAGADVALINSGGIRTDLAAGPVTLLDIYEMLPFDNALVTVELKGADLRRIARANAQASLDHSYGILQTSGLTYAFAAVDGRAQLDEVLVGGRPVADDRAYLVALPDYVAAMRHVYLDNLDLPAWRDTGGGLYDAAVAAVRAAAGPVTATIEGRIRRTR